MHYDDDLDNDVQEIVLTIDMLHHDEECEFTDLAMLVFAGFELQLIMYIVDMQDENEHKFIYVVTLVHLLDDEEDEPLEMLIIQNDDNE